MAQYPPLQPTKTTTNPTSLPSRPVEGAKGGGGGGESLCSGSSVQDVWQRKSLVQVEETTPVYHTMMHPLIGSFVFGPN